MTRTFAARLTTRLLASLSLAASAALAAGPLQDGEQVYRDACAACHGPGPVDAPKYGDREAWAELIAEGQHVITAHGWVGVRAMPARGGHDELSIEEFARAVAHMANAAGADWRDPTGDATLLGRIRLEEADRRRQLALD